MAKRKITKMPAFVAEAKAQKKADPAIEFAEKLTPLGRKRFFALLDELENGKGIARIQASQELAKMESEINGMAENVEIEVNFDAIATHEAASA